MTDSVRNLIMGHVWIFQPYNNPNANLKNNTKMGHWAQNQASAMAIPVLWPEPYRKRVKWTEEKRRSTVMELWIWRIWSDSGWRNGLWSLVRCPLTSSGIIGENSYTILANGGFKVLNKRVPMCPMCIREKHLFHNDISPHFKFLFSNEKLDFCEFFK